MVMHKEKKKEKKNQTGDIREAGIRQRSKVPGCLWGQAVDRRHPQAIS